MAKKNTVGKKGVPSRPRSPSPSRTSRGKVTGSPRKRKAPAATKAKPKAPTATRANSKAKPKGAGTKVAAGAQAKKGSAKTRPAKTGSTKAKTGSVQAKTGSTKNNPAKPRPVANRSKAETSATSSRAAKGRPSRSPSGKKASVQVAQVRSLPHKNPTPRAKPFRAGISSEVPRKRLSKARAARAIARIEDAERREKEKAQQAIAAEKARVRALAAKKKERLRQKKAEAKDRERQLRAREREQIAEQKARLAAEAERERNQQKRERELALAAKKQAKEQARKAQQEARRKRQEERENEKARRLRERELARIEAAISRAEREATLAEEKAERERQRLAKKEQEERAKAEAKALKERALVQAKEHKQRQQAEIRAQKEQQRTEAKEQKERQRAEAKEQKERQRAEAKEQKEQQRAEAKEQKEQLKELRRALADCSKSQSKRYGAPLVDIVRCFVETWEARPDVHLDRIQNGPPASEIALLELQNQLPDEALLWHREWGPVHFSWRFNDDPKEDAPRGAVHIDCTLEHIDSSLHGESPFLRDGESFEKEMMSNLLQAWTRTSGARQKETMGRLETTSAPALLPREAIALSLGVDEKQDKAKNALLDLFDGESRLLVHASQTDEGRRRQELLARGARLPEGEFDPSLLLKMQQGPPVQKAELARLLKAHAQFLQAGGGGGRWQREFSGGLPTFAYLHPSGPTLPPGQARACFENLTGLSCQGLMLPYADFSAIRAPGGQFAKADFTGSTLAYAHLDKASFRGADLTGCDLSRCRLQGADFRGANLTETNFEGANLAGANFASAVTARTRFGGAIVSGIKY